MPILPPDKRVFGDDGGGRGSRPRTRMSGRSEAQEADTTEVICTTCVEYVPNHLALMTARGPTCPDCLPRVQQAAITGGSAMSFVAVGVGIVVALGVALLAAAVFLAQ